MGYKVLNLTAGICCCISAVSAGIFKLLKIKERKIFIAGIVKSAFKCVCGIGVDMELKYIFSKGVIVACVMFLIANVLLFCKGITDNELAYEEEKGYKYSDYVAFYNDCIKELEHTDKNEWSLKVDTYYRENVTEENKKSLLAAVKQIKQQIDYVQSYDAGVVESIKQAETMVSFNIYNDKDSYSYNNILKGRYDLKKLRNLDLDITSEISYNNILGYKYAGYFAAIIMIILVSRFRAESVGFNCIVRTSRKGRGKLALKRALILAAVGLTTAFLTYAPIIIISFAKYGGIGSIGSLIQSNQIFARSIMTISYAELLLNVVLFQCAASVLAGLMAWLFFIIFKDKPISVMGIVVFALFERVLYMIKSGNMFFKFFRTINIFSYMNPPAIFQKYDNFGFGQNIINIKTLSAAGMVVLMAVNLILIVSISSSLWGGFEIKSRFLGNCIRKVKRYFAYLPNRIKELKKTLFIQKGILVIAIVMLYIMTADFGVAGKADDRQLAMADYYNYVQGDAYNKTDEYVEDTKQWIEDARKTAEDLKQKGDILAFNDIDTRIREKETLLKNISDESIRIKELSESGIDSAGILDQHKYEKRYGARMNTYYENFVLTIMFLIIFMTCKTFSIERKNNMDLIIRSTKRGRLSYLRTRFFTDLLIVEAVVLIENIIQYIKVNNVFPIKFYERNLAVQSILCMENSPFNISVIQFEVMLIIYRMIIYGLIAVIIMSLSMYLEESSIFFIGIVALIPYILNSIGIYQLKNFSLVALTAGFGFFQNKSGVFCIVTFLIFLCFISVILLKRAVAKWMK